MKKFILAAVATIVAVSPIAASVAEAQPYQQRSKTTVVQKRNGDVVQRTVVRQQAPKYRSDWRKGQRFDQRQARNYRQIDYRQYRGLRAPPRGYRYVRSGNDAVLVGGNNVIASVIANIFR